MAYRTGLKQYHCLASVTCTEYITALHINKIKDLGQASSETQKTVVSVFGGTIDACVPNVIGGYCWNASRGYDNHSDTEIRYVGGTSVRYHVIFPHPHKGMSLYVGSIPPTDNSIPGVFLGSYEDDNGIEGNQIVLGNKFENKGENRIAIRARYRRGERYQTNADITASKSNTTVLEFNNDDSFPFAYRQHVQCWYCRPNPIIGNPPYKILLFDDSDCPVQTMVDINKIVDISSLVPIAGTSEEHYIVLATWFEAPYFIASSGATPVPHYADNVEFVFNTLWNNTDIQNPDGLLSLTASLFKQC